MSKGRLDLEHKDAQDEESEWWPDSVTSELIIDLLLLIIYFTLPDNGIHFSIYECSSFFFS